MQNETSYNIWVPCFKFNEKNCSNVCFFIHSVWLMRFRYRFHSFIHSFITKSLKTLFFASKRPCVSNEMIIFYANDGESFFIPSKSESSNYLQKRMKSINFKFYLSDMTCLTSGKMAPMILCLVSCEVYSDATILKTLNFSHLWKYIFSLAPHRI